MVAETRTNEDGERLGIVLLGRNRVVMLCSAVLMVDIKVAEQRAGSLSPGQRH
jgi:hypothetical protein